LIENAKLEKTFCFEKKRVDYYGFIPNRCQMKTPVSSLPAGFESTKNYG